MPMDHRGSVRCVVFRVVGAVAASDWLERPIITALAEILEWGHRARHQMPADGFVVGTGIRPVLPTEMCSFSAIHSQPALSTVAQVSTD